MAYTNLVNQYALDKSEVFRRVRDFICKRNGSFDYSTTGIGWTLHDSSYVVDEDNLTANDYFVIKSNGENGKLDLYYQFIFDATANYLNIRGYSYWDNVTHTGYNNFNATDDWYVLESTEQNIWVYGDLDFISLISNQVGTTTRNSCLMGWLKDSDRDSTIAISSAAISSGTNVVVTLDLVPSSWQVGSKVLIRDNQNLQWSSVTNISGTDVTFNDISTPFAAGCKFALDYVVILQNQRNPTAANAMSLLYSHTSSTNQVSTIIYNTNILAHMTPESLNNEYLVVRPRLGAGSVGYYGSLPDSLLISAASIDDNTVYTTDIGVNYRQLDVYSGFYILFKEV